MSRSLPSGADGAVRKFENDLRIAEVIRSASRIFLEPTAPSAPPSEASRHFLMAQPPRLEKAGNGPQPTFPRIGPDFHPRGWPAGPCGFLRRGGCAHQGFPYCAQTGRLVTSRSIL